MIVGPLRDRRGVRLSQDRRDALNTGVQLGRAKVPINDPVTGNGLGVGDEWRFAASAPSRHSEGKYASASTLFRKQTGIYADNNVGDTFSSELQNTPIPGGRRGPYRSSGRRTPSGGLAAGKRSARCIVPEVRRA